MTVERSEPSLQLPERAMLDGWLDYHRATLAMKCEGLSDEQLRLRSVPPSTLSLLGLVRHMADVERQWFRRVLAGEEVRPLYWAEEDPDADFNQLDTADVEADFAAWEEECHRARELAAATPSLDTVGKRRIDPGEVSLRWIMVHMIEEYARHNGHADLLRETIDGTTGD